ncbi:Aldo/keto reductase [Auriscalpium vulgare]|uniref:Aldo/keto reductase n=1 Tax=Auriscalpium vulgare TaxID=40419 RepID=A0ACB8SB46_9AGAM|nr:Aldo/keto reductase [Auriscalpium vulgare]
MASAALTISSTVKLSSGYFMPLLGFGVYQNYTTKPSVLEALAAGYRHVDSAQAYRNESDVGAAIRQSGIPRSEIFVTTKILNPNHGYESTLTGVDTSLAKFGFDYVDLFLIHDPMSGHDRRLATYRALLKARDDGKIRTVGVSNYGVHHLKEIQTAGLELPAVNQIELHPFCQQKEIATWCSEHGIVVQAYCPLVRGAMSDPAIMRIAAKHARDPGQILIRWSIQRGFVPLPKSVTPARIRSNAKLYDFALDAEDMAQLDALDRGKEGAISWNPVDRP